MGKYYVVITEKGEAASIASFLKLNSDDMTALVVGNRELAEEVSRSVSAVKWIDIKSEPAENYASTAAQMLAGLCPAATIAVSSPASRAVIGKAAAITKAPVIPNMLCVSVQGEGLCIECSVLGDKMIDTLEAPLHSYLLLNPFMLQLQEPTAAIAPENIEEIPAVSDGLVELVAQEQVKTSRLQVADIVVGVGLGASSESLFGQAKKLAGQIGAEMGCSMPIYNELHLMPHSHYIGITGTKIAPKLYLALGISGTSQHCAGVRNAKTIVCVNKDPKALFFDYADYGIVGDLNEILPELITALG